MAGYFNRILQSVMSRIRRLAFRYYISASSLNIRQLVTLLLSACEFLSPSVYGFLSRLACESSLLLAIMATYDIHVAVDANELEFDG
jgi:hypothetical protein